MGPLTKLGLAQFSVDKCFIGADAISEDKGVSTINLFRAEVARAMAKSAKKMIVLATSDKVGASAVASSFPLASVHTVITDKDLSREGRSLLDGAAWRSSLSERAEALAEWLRPPATSVAGGLLRWEGA